MYSSLRKPIKPPSGPEVIAMVASMKPISGPEVIAMAAKAIQVEVVGQGTFGVSVRYVMRAEDSTLLSAHTALPVTSIVKKIIPCYYKPDDLNGPITNIEESRKIVVGRQTFEKRYQLIDDCISEFMVHDLAFRKGHEKGMQFVPMPLHIEITPDDPNDTIFAYTQSRSGGGNSMSSGVLVELRTALVNIYMEYIPPTRPLTIQDIPRMRSTFLEFTKLGFIHGDMTANNFMIHPGGQYGPFFILLDFGSSLVWKTDLAVRTEELQHLLHDHFGNFELALQSNKGIQYAWLANVISAKIISYNGCFSKMFERADGNTGYSLYQYMLTGQFGSYDDTIDCNGNNIERIDFDELFRRDLDTQPENHTISLAKNITFDAVPGAWLTKINDVKNVNSEGRFVLPASLKKGGRRRKRTRSKYRRPPRRP
jgi:hypothetical protein